MLGEIGVDLPVLAAPMAGGPTTPAMVIAAARAASLGFLAAGYKSAEALAEQLAEVRAETPTFAVNLFAPNPVGIDAASLRRYAQAILPSADAYRLDLSTEQATDDDDAWQAKVDLLVGDPVPIVSFTFGLPDPATILALHRAGSLLVQTVTSPAEASAALEAGIDALAVQSPQAGGHSGTFTPDRPLQNRRLPELVGAVRAVTKVPMIAAGGVAGPDDVVAAIEAGATAVAVGTLLMLSDESGSSAAHKAALVDKRDVETTITRAFTGRPARAVRNAFVDRYDDIAPLGYPAVHHLTSGLRRAAAAAGDQENIHIWAGTGHSAIRTGTTGEILSDLAGRL